ncbi:MAG: hypothetical protein ACM3RP_07850 [Chitinophagales bacterium]
MNGRSGATARAKRASQVCLLLLLTVLCRPVAVLAGGESPAGPGDALAVYAESERPALDYEATVTVRLPLGSGSFDVISAGGVTYLRPSKAPGLPPGRAAAAGFAPEAERLFANELLRQNYTVDIKNGPVLLGRETWEITLTPRWQGSPSRRAIIDRATRVRMVVEDRDHAGRVLQRREVISFQPAPGRQAARPVRRAGGKERWLSAEQAASTVGPWLRYPRYLPPGYRLVGVRVGPKPGGFVHLAFFDGLGVISLYEREVPWWARPGVREGAERGGFAWTHDGIRFYLVGDVPPEELRRIADSLR